MDPFIGVACKALEYVGNGYSLDGRHGLGRVKWSSFDRLILIGQSHLDAAWRWRTKQGILKARATIKKALDHIDDPSLPTFTFTQPSPQYYQWMKDHFPDIYRRIKKAVADGRFLPMGGSWVEMDTNLPSGESLVRQRLYGQRFYLDEFGFTADLEFLQDCFGFNWNLPQIFKKSGARLFGTGKMFWNKTEPIPLGMCHWRGVDGTELPTVHIHFGYFLPLNYGKQYPLIYLLGKPGKELVANYQTQPKEFQEWRSKEYMLENIFGYGLGDGGHGPIELELWAVETLRKRFPKKIKHHQRGDVYHMFKKFFPRWATWNDEWFLDDHRGTYTSWDLIKRGNRFSENKMEIAEKLEAILTLFGLPSQRKDYEQCWKVILYNQFHDILPGTSIPEVYIDYKKDLKKIDKFFEDQNARFINFILSNVQIKEEYGRPFIIFNPLSWTRKDTIKINIGSEKKGIVRNQDGDILDSEIVENVWLADEPNVKEQILIVSGHQMAPMSIDVLYFDTKEAGAQKDLQGTELVLEENDSEFVLKNEFYILKISKSDGFISEITHKKRNINVLSGKSNVIRVFQDLKRHEHAWNIPPDYQEHPINYDHSNCEITILEDNSIRKCIKVTRKIENSTHHQFIGLQKHSQLILLSMDIDFKDPERMIKLEFDTNLKTNRTSSEIAYAYIDRTITPTTKLDKARWEQNHQKFVSLFDEEQDLGLTIVNNTKYGFNAVKNSGGGVILRETVMRSPQSSGYYEETIFVNKASDGGLDPNMPPFADIKYHHNITYGLILHDGNWCNGSWKYAYELNLPHLAVFGAKPSSTKKDKKLLNTPYSLLDISPSTVQVGAIKIAEDENDLESPKAYILRLIERVGKETQVVINLNTKKKIISANEYDLLELNEMDSNVSIQDQKISCKISPHEIKTIKVMLE